MKKLIVLFIMFCFISPVFAEVKAPEWSEFAPKKYLNAEYKNISTFDNIRTVTDFLLICSLFGAPIGIVDMSMRKKKNINNMWALRKQRFKNDIKNCNQLSNNDSIVMCYSQVRQNQYAIDNRPIVNVYNSNTNYTNYVPLRY